VYTRKGDSGQTRLAGGARVSKADEVVAVYGTIDELNCALGVAAEHIQAARPQSSSPNDPRLDALLSALRQIQNELFCVGTVVATPDGASTPVGAKLSDSATARLEKQIDHFAARQGPLGSFIIPGGGPISAALHLARAICRRAERDLVRLAIPDASNDPTVAKQRDEHQIMFGRELGYLNRLSDWLFVASREACAAQGAPEQLWRPGSGS